MKKITIELEIITTNDNWIHDWIWFCQEELEDGESITIKNILTEQEEA